MAVAKDLSFTFVAEDVDESFAGQIDYRAALEKGTDDVKLETLRRIIVQMLNGNKHEALLMPIIQFVLPCKDKHIKKLLHFYWEICPKLDDDGKLKQEMILVCNAIRNDLQHPNEYIRGATLRFLQKIQEPELLEPLIPTLRQCLEHRHSYVRKNAVMAIFTIYKNFEALIPDASELIHTYIAAESDTTSIRNAFVMLQTTAPELAIDYFLQIDAQVASLDEAMQLAVIELIKKESGSDVEPALKARYIKCIFELLESGSHSVKYEAATNLPTLTQTPGAIKAAASSLISLVLNEPSNNVKMIVLARIAQLYTKHETVLDDLVMDVLRVVACPDLEIRRKAFELVLRMTSSKNVVEIVQFLKKELLRTLGAAQPQTAEYRQLVIQTIHTCAITHAKVAADVVHVLLEFVADPASSGGAAIDVIAFVRQVAETFPDLRPGIVERLLAAFPEIRTGKVFRGALWIVGEYASEPADCLRAIEQVRGAIGELPILAAEARAAAAARDEDETAPAATTTTRILPDGTYATETAFAAPAAPAANAPPLRALILGGDYYTAAVLAATLTKIVLKYGGAEANGVNGASASAASANQLRAQAMLIMTSILRVGQSTYATVPIDEDAAERIAECLQTLASPTLPVAEVRGAFLTDTQDAYARMVAADAQREADERALDERATQVRVDEPVRFRQFAVPPPPVEDVVPAAEPADDFISKLARVVQLTGFSDPVYAEAYVNVHQFDIFLDVLVVNQTTETLQNLTVEFATLGDLKLLERPAAYTLGPHSFQAIKATIKVSSTETGVIFGNIFYEGTGPIADGLATIDNSNAHCVVLNDIHIDILDYIKPGTCSETQFRSMWTEFEWENKVNVNTGITDLKQYLQHIMRSTNMSCLTTQHGGGSVVKAQTLPEYLLADEPADEEDDCAFLSANLYAQSVFGEDALANLSIEKVQDGTLQGHVRIRSKTQGIALSLGDRITLQQKTL